MDATAGSSGSNSMLSATSATGAKPAKPKKLSKTVTFAIARPRSFPARGMNSSSTDGSVSDSKPKVIHNNTETSLDGSPSNSWAESNASASIEDASAALNNMVDINETNKPSKGSRSIGTETQTQLHRQPAQRRKPVSSLGQRKGSRLPWLDGNLGRRPSNPRVPGAFDSPTIQTTQTQEQHLPQALGSSDVSRHHAPNDEEAAYTRVLTPSVQSTSPQPFESSKSIHSVGQGPSDSCIVKESLPHVESNVTLAPKPIRPKGAHISVASIARQLAPSESTTASSSEAASASFNAPHIATLRTIGESNASPLAFKKQKTAHFKTASDDSLMAERRRSIGVQPLRSSKVKQFEEDQSPANRKISLAVQPIRSRTNKSLSEDVVPSHTKVSKPPAIPQRTTSVPPVKKQSPPRVSETADFASQNLHNSIAGLETLMQEAMRLAKDAAEQDRSNEVPVIFEEARETLRRASTIHNRNDLFLRKDSSVFHNSDSGSEASSASRTHDFSDSSESSTSIVLVKDTPRGSTAIIKTNPSPASPRMGDVLPPDVRTGAPRTIWDEDLVEPTSNTFPGVMAGPSTQSTNWSQNFASKTTNILSAESKHRKGKTKPWPISSTVVKPESSHTPGEERVNHVLRSASAREEPKTGNFAVNQTRYFSGDGSIADQRVVGHDGVDSAAAQTPSPMDEDVDPTRPSIAPELANWGRDKYDENDYVNADGLRGRHHLTLKEGERFSIHRNHKRQPIARNWSTPRKRFTAFVACFDTALVGMLIGIYEAGEVPAIQYALADQHHQVILGNVVLYIAMGIVTFVCWPLPLLHGRKPYTLLALAIALPLQFPQAVIVREQRDPNYAGFKVGLLLSRALMGLALGFAHINFKSTLLDLFGASLQSNRPHGEVVLTNDVRRHGGGMGLWLGVWSWCFIGSLALGFLVGADVISGLNVSWGFYISVMLIAATLLLNVIAPETRRLPHRRTVQDVDLPNDTVSRRVARGEIKMHVSGDGPKWWWEEVLAGLYLSLRMLSQTGFLVMALYVAWIYAEVVLIIVLLGNLLSAQYRWRPEYVGLGVLSVAVGALLAVPNSKANIFSHSRVRGPRTDSMTYQPRISWTSHLVRRALFMIALPVAGAGYTLASAGKSISYTVPIVLAGLIGYISNLAIAECNGIIMETFDTSDLQPGTNSRHRLQSLAPTTRRRRTTYSSYPRVSAGFFSSQALAFFFAAAATGVGGAVTRKIGAQRATAITAGILLGLTLLLTCALWRFKSVQIIPNDLFGRYFGSESKRKSTASVDSDKSWRAVIIGTPSGQTRRMSWLELGGLSRWTEIRRLNRLLSRSSTQPLNPGWQ